MSDALWKTLGDLAIFAAAAVTLLFAMAYATLAPWWRTETGRNIMAVMGVLAMALGYFGWIIARGAIPEGFYPIRFTIFAVLGLVIGQRLIIFVKRQILARRSEEDPNELEDAR